MNLINKKLKDKIKLLDEIEKQYIPKIDSEQIQYKKDENDLYTNSIEIMKNTKKEKFDNVYSNFNLNDDILKRNKYFRNRRNYYLISNNIDKYPTNENSKYAINLNKRMHNKEKSNQNKVEIKNKINNNSKNKNKLSKQKIIKTRNKTEKNVSGLIQNYKKTINKSYTKLSKTNNKSKSKQNKSNSSTKDDINNFTYHPKLNKRSLLLAKKMEPASIRLNKNKKKLSEEKLKPKKFYVNLYNHKQNNTPRKTSKKKEENKNKTIYDKMNNLYLRGIEQKQKQQKKISENKIKKENEYKQFSYKPNINKIIPYYSNKNRTKKNLNININGIKIKNNNSKKEIRTHNIYEKNFEWKKNLEKENIKKKKINDEKIKSFCTFRPNLSEKNFLPQGNKKILNKVFEQMNDYVYKRQRNLKYKKSEENFRKKKFYVGGEGYTPRSTIPQEFEFQTELREHSLSKNKNRSCENFHINKNSSEKNKIRKNFEENENHFWFFKEEMNNNGYNSNINESKVTKGTNSHTQLDFIEAVNILHEKLDKLNI